MDYLVQRIDVGIVVAFLFINLIVGLSHRYLEKDFREYALGGKNFSTAALVATIVATAASGSSMFVILENTYEHGLYYLIAHLGLPVGMIIMGQLTVRMGEFLNNVSVAEAMGNLYGKTVQIITAVSGILRKVGFVVIQFKVMSQLLSMLWGADNTIMLLAAAGIVIVYSTLGGVRAVTFTDVLQFFTLGATLPILALTIWNNLPEPAQVNATLAHNSMFDVQEVIGLNPPFTATLALFFFLAIPGFEPALFQRIAMARDARQARKALTYSAGILLLISLLIAWMSILLLTDKPGLAPGQIFFYLINHHAYVGLRGLLGVGVIAMAMSTADSYLNTCSVLFANDIVAPLTEQPNNLVSTARIFSLIIGLAALSLTFFGEESNFLTLTLFFGSLYMPVYVVPLLVAILGFRSTPRAVLIGMATGCITVVVWSIYFDNTSSIAPGMLANLAGFMGSHYLLREEGGWVGIKDKQPLLAAKRARQVAWQMLPKFFKNFQLYTYLKSNLPAEEKTYALLGLYGLGATYLSFFTLPETVVGTYPMLHTFLSYSVSTAAMVFLTYPAWPAVLKNKRLMAVVWPIGLGHLLFSVGTMLILLSGFHPVQIMVFSFSLIMAALLISWPFMLILSLISIAIGISTFYLCTDVVPLPCSTSELLLRLAYFLPIFSSFFFSFYVLLKYKRAYVQLEITNDSLSTDLKRLNITNKEITSDLLVASMDKTRFFKAFRQIELANFRKLAQLSRQLEEETQRMDHTEAIATKARALREELAPITTQLSRLDHRAADYMALKVSTISVDRLLQAVQDALYAKDLAQHVYFEPADRQKTLQCDVVQIVTVLVGSVSLLRMIQGDEAPVRIGVKDTQLYYLLDSIKKDRIHQLPALQFIITTGEMLPNWEQVYTIYMDTSTLSAPTATQELPLVKNKRIVDAHYGYSYTSIQTDACTLQYIIPLALRAVRPKDMEDREMKLAIQLMRADDTCPGAQEQEQRFLIAVAERTTADMQRVRQAVETIKVYHGLAKNKLGQSFYLSSLAVAHIALDYNTEEATLLGALFYEAIKGKQLLPEHIEIRYDDEVIQLTAGLREFHNNKDKFYTIKHSAAENIQHLLEVRDPRVLYIVLADRMHTMRTIKSTSYEDQFRLAEETLLFLVPLAERLALTETAVELKQLCMETLNQDESSVECLG